MDPPCFILGTGLVTAQGLGVQSNWQRLLDGHVLHETGIVPIVRDPALPRVSQLAIHAASEAWTAAGRPSLDGERIALIVGTSKGPIEDWIEQLDGRRPPDITLGLARVATDVATALGHRRGPRLTYAGACASGLHAAIRASELIKRGTCDRALVVATEASTHALFQANFARLGVLASPEDGCRPFDARRRGFLLAEGAAAVWMSNESTTPAVAIDRTACFADATHLTGFDRSGDALAHALSAVDGDRIDLVHAHGTGTTLNDPIELTAIARVYGRHRPTLYSHKHAIGHTQGAAGLIGLVLSIASHRDSIVPGNSNSALVIDDSARVVFDSKSLTTQVSRSVTIAAGFGGTIASISLQTRLPS